VQGNEGQPKTPAAYEQGYDGQLTSPASYAQGYDSELTRAAEYAQGYDGQLTRPGDAEYGALSAANPHPRRATKRGNGMPTTMPNAFYGAAEQPGAPGQVEGQAAPGGTTKATAVEATYAVPMAAAEPGCELPTYGAVLDFGQGSPGAQGSSAPGRSVHVVDDVAYVGAAGSTTATADYAEAPPSGHAGDCETLYADGAACTEGPDAGYLHVVGAAAHDTDA